MGKIKKEIEIVGLKGSKKVEALFDSGAGGNVVRQIFSDGVSAEDLGFTKYRFPGKIRLGDNRFKRAEFIAFPKLVIDNVPVEKPEMAIMKDLPYDVIIGAYLMQSIGIILNRTYALEPSLYRG
jgi:hypothetical protein